ncbi:hypothetical protein [Paludibaculum fermentans]|uniref:Uncharacterized protein n=1 Tax=Paludibaculum fermentans TaxID=1473598 RepID=A0A7S7NQG2_PALFE|nr:hypothetical protein [Paludibaculum fermentans]QOY87903.1 hypothetical protein IRI77_35075 [Paludibaculum fermentans]
MPHSAFGNRAARIYYGFGLLLLALVPLQYLYLPLGTNVSDAIVTLCLAALALPFASLQSNLAGPMQLRTLAPWLYGAGTILTMISAPWLQESITKLGRDAQGTFLIGLVDLLFPGMILLPVAALIVGTLRRNRQRPGSGYLLGGLCLLAVCTGRIWLNLFNNHFELAPSADSIMSGLMWTPASFVVATAGVTLGSLPPELHLASRSASAMLLCYLLAILLIPLGASTSLADHETQAYVTLLLITMLVCVPASQLTRVWIMSKPVGRPN